MRRLYCIGLIVYTIIILRYAFPEKIALGHIKMVHISFFVFAIFVVDCCISLWLDRRRKEQPQGNKREIERKKRKVSFWITTYLFSSSITLAFISDHIPLERIDIKLGAFIFVYYFFFHFLPYMKEKRGEEEDPAELEKREQEHKRIETEIEQLGKQKWYLKSKVVYVLCFITPPIGYIYVLLLRKKMPEDVKMTYLVVATIIMGLWSLKFLPPHLYAIVVVIVAFLVFIGKYIR
ncbi:hypothetical protein AALF16_11070 [Bacillus cereus]|uniref:hypothetical protein n=1 Tax=Bacillus cereus TaxID=1396 RepID=UPI00356CED7A